MKDGRQIAVDIDLAKFFDTVSHDVLMSLLGRTIRDKRLLALIGRYLRAGVLVGEHVGRSRCAAQVRCPFPRCNAHGHVVNSGGLIVQHISPEGTPP